MVTAFADNYMGHSLPEFLHIAEKLDGDNWSAPHSQKFLAHEEVLGKGSWGVRISLRRIWGKCSKVVKILFLLSTLQPAIKSLISLSLPPSSLHMLEEQVQKMANYQSQLSYGSLPKKHAIPSCNLPVSSWLEAKSNNSIPSWSVPKATKCCRN